VGPPVSLGALLDGSPHSLVDQARHARYQSSGTENPDGWGVAWFDESGDMHRYRSATPIWTDPACAQLAECVVAGDVVAAVRLASPGARVEEAGNAPFVADDRWLFSLNGVVDGFHDGLDDELRALVSEPRRAAIEGGSDSEVLFALALDRLDAGRSALDALADVVGVVEERTTGRLNLILSEPGAVTATAVGNSLFRRDATLVASEPIDDDPEWVRLPDRSLLTIDGVGLSVEAL